MPRSADTPEPHVDDALRRFRSAFSVLAAPMRRGVLLAASGGPDSTALLRLFQLARARAFDAGEAFPALAVAHVDHGLREDSSTDAGFVRALAARFDLDFVTARVDARENARRRGVSIELAARDLRYDLLERWADARGLTAVATGHTADDQKETVLLRICRGAGFRGLSGMNPARRLGNASDSPWLVRPLLDWSRTDVVEFLDLLRQDYREDATNHDESIPRNAVRRRVLPALEELVHPGAGAALLRLAEHARDVEDALETRCAELEPLVRAPDADDPRRCALRLRAFAELPRALRHAFLSRVLRESSPVPGHAKSSTAPMLSAALLEELERRLRTPEKTDRPRHVDLGAGWFLEIDRARDRLFVARAASSDQERESPRREPVELSVDAPARWGDWRVDVELVEPEEARSEFTASRFEEIVDADRLHDGTTLVVRGRRTGDRLRPLGSPGAKTLKEFLRESGIPPTRRDDVPLVVARRGDAEEIVWVVGARIAHAFRVTETSRRIARLRAESSEAGQSPNQSFSPTA